MDALLIKGVSIFVLMAMTDFFYARYTQAVTSKLATWAATHAGLLYLLSGLVTLGYVNEPWLLGPAVSGAFVGTFIAVKWENQ